MIETKEPVVNTSRTYCEACGEKRNESMGKTIRAYCSKHLAEHTNHTESLDERVDEHFYMPQIYQRNEAYDIQTDALKLKSFISQELQRQREELVEKVKEEREGSDTQEEFRAFSRFLELLEQS